MIDLDDLKRKALAAIRGDLTRGDTNRVRWFAVDDQTVAWSPVIDGRDTGKPQGYADTYDIRETEYIAASNPAAMLALVEIAEAAVAWSRAVADSDADYKVQDDACAKLFEVVKAVTR